MEIIGIIMSMILIVAALVGVLGYGIHLRLIDLEKQIKELNKVRKK